MDNGPQILTNCGEQIVTGNSIVIQIVDKLKTLTLLEAAELVKEIETTFGVDAR